MSKGLLSGHEFEEVSEEDLKDMDLDVFSHGMIRILPEGWLYPTAAITYLNKINSMKYRDDDVMVMAFPKCGITWMQEIVWTMLHNPNLDNPAASQAAWLRTIGMHTEMLSDLKTMKGLPPPSLMEAYRTTLPDKRWEEGMFVQVAEVSPSPRIFRCHFGLSLLPRDILDKIKVVYVARNPKDVAISYFHFLTMLKIFPFHLTKDETCKALMADKAFYSPYWPHVKQAWQQRHHPNLHFIFFEDLKADIMLELKKLDEFLGTRLSQQTLERVAQHTSFSAMKCRGEPLKEDIFEKNNGSEAAFFRKGKSGDWKNHISPQLQKEMDWWIEENLEGTDLSLSWALAQ